MNRRLSNHNGSLYYCLNKFDTLDKCLITPGTTFMIDLNQRTINFIETVLRAEFKDCRFQLSGHDDFSEGETKIFDEIVKRLEPNEHYFVYSEDSDIIFYSLLRKINNLTILNMREFNPLKIETIKMATIFDYLAKYFNDFNFEKAVRDLVFVFLFSGCDYAQGLFTFEISSENLIAKLNYKITKSNYH